MDGSVAGAGNAATTATLGCESRSGLGCESENPNEWLRATALTVFGKDAGLHLANLTGYPESSCYAYVANDWRKRRRPPEHFARAVIHASDDPRFFDAFMHGCTAPWWIELQRAAEVGRQVLAITGR